MQEPVHTEVPISIVAQQPKQAFHWQFGVVSVWSVIKVKCWQLLFLRTIRSHLYVSWATYLTDISTIMSEENGCSINMVSEEKAKQCKLLVWDSLKRHYYDSHRASRGVHWYVLIQSFLWNPCWYSGRHCVFDEQHLFLLQPIRFLTAVNQSALISKIL